MTSWYTLKLVQIACPSVIEWYIHSYRSKILGTKQCLERKAFFGFVLLIVCRRVGVYACNCVALQINRCRRVIFVCVCAFACMLMFVLRGLCHTLCLGEAERVAGMVLKSHHRLFPIEVIIV